MSVQKLDGSVNGEDMKVTDAPEDMVKPSLNQFLGKEPDAAPAPQSSMSQPMGPVTTTVTNEVAPTTTGSPTVTSEPPAAGLPDGKYGSFKDVDTMYKSWRESSKKISQDGEEKKRLAQELERERQLRMSYEQQQRQNFTPPQAVPTLTKEQALEQFVNDPLAYQQQLKQQIAQEYLAPVVNALQQMYNEQQVLRERETVNAEDRTLYDQFKQDGIFDSMRQNPRYARYSNADLLELGKAQMIQHQVNELQAQVDKTKQSQASRNARVVVESGGSPTAPAKTPDQFSEDELKSEARLAWQAGERF